MPIRQLSDVWLSAGEYAALPNSSKRWFKTTAMSVRVPLQNNIDFGVFAPFSLTRSMSHPKCLNISSLLHLIMDIRRFGRFGLTKNFFTCFNSSCLMMTLCVCPSAVPVRARMGVPTRSIRSDQMCDSQKCLSGRQSYFVLSKAS